MTVQAQSGQTAIRKTGTRLKEFKAEANISWDTLAGESRVSRRRLFEIAAGAEPSRETAFKLKKYFTARDVDL